MDVLIYIFNRKVCALYQRWWSSVLGDLPNLCPHLFTNDVLCFTNLLESSFGAVIHFSLYDKLF